VGEFDDSEIKQAYAVYALQHVNIAVRRYDRRMMLPSPMSCGERVGPLSILIPGLYAIGMAGKRLMIEHVANAGPPLIELE
jgi:hypothetical protein